MVLVISIQYSPVPIAALKGAVIGGGLSCLCCAYPRRRTLRLFPRCPRASGISSAAADRALPRLIGAAR
jgi:hypothetical protein